MGTKCGQQLLLYHFVYTDRISLYQVLA